MSAVTAPEDVIPGGTLPAGIRVPVFAQAIQRRSAIARVLALSAAIVVPCYWQARIQAGDLSSHVYNAWLGYLVEQNQVPGLAFGRQWTNVLFDLLLASLGRAVGLDLAQKLVVSAAVLLFFWASFALCCRLGGRRPWSLAPCLAILAYGWVFHMGFFNFYLSCGFCMAALAIVWRPCLRSVAVALPLLCLALSAHLLPVLWFVGIAGFVVAGSFFGKRDPMAFLLAAMFLMVVAWLCLRSLVPMLFVPPRLDVILRLTGLDQTWVFGGRYLIIAVAVFFGWALLFDQLIESRGWWRLAASMPFQLFLLHCLGLLLLPAAFLLNDKNVAFSFIGERFSLLAGVAALGFLSAAHIGKRVRLLLVVAASLYFTFLYVDWRRLNAIEAQMAALVTTLPPQQRVIAPLHLSGSRVNGLLHAVDRACVQNCYSYANYEPATFAFRLRAWQPNKAVMSDSRNVIAVESRSYTITGDEEPVHQVFFCEAGSARICLKTLRDGDVTQTSSADVLPSFASLFVASDRLEVLSRRATGP